MTTNTTFGRYTLVERLAAGSVADLYRATTSMADGSSLMVVIKRIRQELSSDPIFAGAFEDEAKIAASLQHPNIAKVYEWSRVDDALFIALEYIEGTNLASLLQSCSEQQVRFPATMALHIVSELCAGLQYAHGLTDNFGHPLGIVHRGINPRNVIISSDGHVKLVDFGMAKASSRVHGTRPGAFGSATTYMAPEVIQRAACDARADVFSAGVVLYELLTGAKLHNASETGPQALVETMRARPPSAVQPDIPSDLDQVVVQAAAWDPSQRFQTAGQLGQALLTLLQRWDRQVDAEELSSFLVEVLSGRSAGKPAGGFAFGEATSHWFAEGEELVQTDLTDGQIPEVAAPDASGLDLAMAPDPFAQEPLMAPPKGGGFSAGSTVMAVEDSGLGKKRHLKAFGIVGGVVVAVVLLVALVLSNLSKDPNEEAKKAPKVEVNAGGFAGPVQVMAEPEGVLIFVDGDPVRMVGNPPRLLNLRSGKRRLRLMAPGYLPWEADLVLEKDKPTLVSQKLEPRIGKLVIRSKPKGALIFLDGKKAGRTPKTFENLSAAKAYKISLLAKRYSLLKFELRPSDWPDDPAAVLEIDKQLTRPAKRKQRRRRRGR